MTDIKTWIQGQLVVMARRTAGPWYFEEFKCNPPRPIAIWSGHPWEVHGKVVADMGQSGASHEDVKAIVTATNHYEKALLALARAADALDQLQTATADRLLAHGPLSPQYVALVRTELDEARQMIEEVRG